MKKKLRLKKPIRDALCAILTCLIYALWIWMFIRMGLFLIGIDF